jgi:hypothetical protein
MRGYKPRRVFNNTTACLYNSICLTNARCVAIVTCGWFLTPYLLITKMYSVSSCLPPPPNTPRVFFAKPTRGTAQWAYESTWRIGRWPQLIWPLPGGGGGERYTILALGGFNNSHFRKCDPLHGTAVDRNPCCFSPKRQCWRHVSSLLNVLHRSWHKKVYPLRVFPFSFFTFIFSVYKFPFSLICFPTANRSYEIGDWLAALSRI